MPLTTSYGNKELKALTNVRCFRVSSDSLSSTMIEVILECIRSQFALNHLENDLTFRFSFPLISPSIFDHQAGMLLHFCRDEVLVYSGFLKNQAEICFQVPLTNLMWLIVTLNKYLPVVNCHQWELIFLLYTQLTRRK